MEYMYSELTKRQLSYTAAAAASSSIIQADHSMGTVCVKFPDISLTLPSTPNHVGLLRPISSIHFSQCYKYTTASLQTVKNGSTARKTFQMAKKPKQYTEHRHSPKLKTDFHDQDISPTFGQFRDIWPGFPDKRVYARRSRAISSLIISLVPSMM